MPNWLNPDEAMRYFGVDLDGLEDLVVKYKVDVDVDDEGKLLHIDADDCKEPLFKEHEKKHGHRPDDFKAMDKAKKEHEEKEKKEKEDREQKKDKLAHRVSKRQNGG